MTIDGQVAFFQMLQGEDLDRRFVSSGGGGPATAFSSPTMPDNDSGDANYSMRILFRSAVLLASGSQVRVRFRASTAAAFNVDNASIGEHTGVTTASTTAATPVSLLFSAAAGFSIAAGAAITSDWLTFTFDNTKSYVVIFDISSTNGNPGGNASKTNVNSFYKSATNSYNSTSGASFSLLANYLLGIDLIEVQ